MTRAGEAGGRDRRPQRDQGGGVVEQRLALEDRDDASRQPDPAADRRGRDGVGRRDDRADRERQRPAEVGQQQVDDHGHPGGGEDDQSDRQQQDRSPVGVEVDEGGLHRGGVQQRRQQAEQHHVGLEMDLRHHRQEGARHADDDQQQRRRQADPLRDGGPGQDHDGQDDQEEGDLHPAIPAEQRWATTCSAEAWPPGPGPRGRAPGRRPRSPTGRPRPTPSARDVLSGWIAATTAPTASVQPMPMTGAATAPARIRTQSGPATGERDAEGDRGDHEAQQAREEQRALEGALVQSAGGADGDRLEGPADDGRDGGDERDA